MIIVLIILKGGFNVLSRMLHNTIFMINQIITAITAQPHAPMSLYSRCSKPCARLFWSIKAYVAAHTRVQAVHIPKVITV